MSTDPKSPPHSSAHSSSPFPNTDDQDSDVVLDILPLQQRPDSLAPPLPASAPASKPPSAVHSKPKSSRARRSKSRSPPPPPPPPLTTIRLEITLGGPENYDVDIAATAKATGQRPPTPPPPKARDTDDSEPDDEDRNKDQIKPKKRKRKNYASEFYDVADPFIDDSELAVDERTYFAQTKQTGFYVSSGEVALLKDKTPKKPKSRRRNPADGAAGPSTATAGASASIPTIQLHSKARPPDGSLDSPFALGSDDENCPAPKPKRYITIFERGKHRKIVDLTSFHPEIQDAVADLKEAIAGENWEVKSKFPTSLKPKLVDVAVRAIIRGEYDDHFFNLMPTIFPYNKFTMLKLIKRSVFPEHTRILVERQQVLLDELSQLARDGFSRAQEEHMRSVALWEKRQDKLKAESEESKLGDDPGSGMDVDGPMNGGAPRGNSESAGASSSAKEPPARPGTRYRLTDRMKSIVWRLVSLSNEICGLENEKNTLEGSTMQVSEQGLRKMLYQKIVSAFPEGWMSSGQISREVSAMKKKLEKEAQDQIES